MAWMHTHGIEHLLIQPGKPTQNAYIESFNGKFRDEYLNEQWFETLAQERNYNHPIMIRGFLKKLGVRDLSFTWSIINNCTIAQKRLHQLVVHNLVQLHPNN